MSALAAFRNLRCMTDLLSWFEDNVLDAKIALDLANHLSVAVDQLRAVQMRLGLPIQSFPFSYRVGRFHIRDQPVLSIVLTLTGPSGEHFNWVLELDADEKVTNVSLFVDSGGDLSPTRTLH